MRLFRLFPFLFVVGSIKGDISSMFGGTRMLSTRDVAEITRIAGENMEEEMRKSLGEEEQEPPIYVEPTPPPFPESTTPSSADEIEVIRRNITQDGPVECNITARYLWELCRPVLLRTCKEQYLTHCRRDRTRNSIFARRLNRMFPMYRPPRLPIFKPKPILEWFEDQISRLNDTANFQFTLIVTNNNETRTYSNQIAHHLSDEVQRGLHHMRRKYGHFFRGFHLPERRSGESFADWVMRFLEEDDDNEEARRVETGDEYDGEEEDESPSSKSRGFNPSVIVPKRRVKKWKPRRAKRHFRPWYRNFRPSRMGGGNRNRYSGAAPRRPSMMGDGNINSYSGRAPTNRRQRQHMSHHPRIWNAQPRHHNFASPQGAIPTRNKNPPPPMYSPPPRVITRTRNENPRPPYFHPPRVNIPTRNKNPPPPMYSPLPRVITRTRNENSPPRPRFPHRHHHRFITSWMQGRRFPNIFGRDGDDDDDDDNRRWQWHMPSWVPPDRIPNIFGDDDDEDEDGEDIPCREMERNPDVCLEIVERTEKCENELETACPEYVATRRRLKDQLNNVFSRQHQYTQISNSVGEDETNDNYQWAIELGDYEEPIVIESIKISRRGGGDAFVTAKLFDNVKVNMRVPASDFDSDQSLGEAIGKLAIQSYADSYARRRQKDP